MQKSLKFLNENLAVDTRKNTDASSVITKVPRVVVKGFLVSVLTVVAVGGVNV